MKDKKCIECSENFKNSYLLENFDYECCNECREPRGKHDLIPRTNAKERYLLTDTDIDREPQLSYIIRPNPHARRYYDNCEMKLYLKLQVKERAVEKWGSLEDIQKEKRMRRQKKLQKVQIARISERRRVTEEKRLKIKTLLHRKDRNKVKKVITSHVHKFDEWKSTDETRGTFTHSCKRCGFEETGERTT